MARSGPHPDKQRKRTELQGARRSLIGMLAAGAIAAGCLAVLRPGGTALLIALGLAQAIALGLIATRRRRARLVALAAAIAPAAWGFERVMVLDGATLFELGLICVGLFEAFLIAGASPRDTGPRRRQRGSR